MTTVCEINLDNIAYLIESQQTVILNNENRVELVYSDFLKVKEEYENKIKSERIIYKTNIIKCLEKISKYPVYPVHYSDTEEILESLEITYNNFIIEWCILEKTVYLACKDLILKTYPKPTTLEEWNELFKDSFNKAKLFIEEPNLIELLKKAFASYNLSYNSKSKFYEGNNGKYNLTIEARTEKVTFFRVIKDNYEVYSLSMPYRILTKQNLANYFNWEQWLVDLIKLKQNIADLEQSPNLTMN
jgi:hypothetical protein